MENAARKNLGTADEVRDFPKGRVELVNMGKDVIGRLTLEPGWKWSQHIKPIAGTEWCEMPHYQYHVSGRLHVKMTNGDEFDLVAGSVASIPPGHDAWVVGNEPVVIVDWSGARNYAMALDRAA